MGIEPTPSCQLPGEPLGAGWWGVKYLYTSVLGADMANSTSRLSQKHPRDDKLSPMALC